MRLLWVVWVVWVVWLLWRLVGCEAVVMRCGQSNRFLLSLRLLESLHQPVDKWLDDEDLESTADRHLQPSRRRDCHFTGIPFPSILKHRLKGEWDAAEWQPRRRLLQPGSELRTQHLSGPARRGGCQSRAQNTCWDCCLL